MLLVTLPCPEQPVTENCISQKVNSTWLRSPNPDPYQNEQTRGRFSRGFPVARIPKASHTPVGGSVQALHLPDSADHTLIM